jgi:apolipoprotein N-acyltransferase
MGQFHKTFGVSLFFYIIAVLIPSLVVFSLFTVLYRLLYKNTMLFFCAILPSLWILHDYIYEAVPFFIPWAFIGYSTFPMDNYRLFASFGGIYSLSFLIVCINGSLYFLFNKIKLLDVLKKLKNKNFYPLKVILSEKTVITACIIIVSAIALPLSYGWFHKYTIEKKIKNSTAYSVKIVQGNFGLKERWLSSSFINRMNTYLSLSRKDKKDGRALIIWPETVLNSSGQVNKDLFKHLIKSLGREKTLIAGGIRRDKKRKVYNTAFSINGLGIVSWYDKKILLPYSENVPGVDVLGKFYDAPASFVPGSINPVLSTLEGTAGLSICFEVVYGRHIKQAVDLGADFLVNISNDTWFGDSAMPWLHLHSAAFRAIETGRYMLRASNSGISAIISPSGKIQKRTDLFKRCFITGDFVPLKDKTFYSSTGNWILFLALLILLIPLIQFIFSKGKPGRKGLISLFFIKIYLISAPGLFKLY